MSGAEENMGAEHTRSDTEFSEGCLTRSFTTCTLRLVQSRRIGWTGHVARMGRRGMDVGYWCECQIERDH
jgi:hypothetical protein